MTDWYAHTFGMRIHFANGHDIHWFIDLAADLGFAGVNLSVLDDPRLHHLGSAEPAHIAEVAAHLSAAGLGCDLETRGTEPGHLVSMLDLAARLGAHSLRTFTLHDTDPLDRTAADLRASIGAAQTVGIPLLLENHEDFNGREMAQIMTVVDSEWVACLYDYGNSQMVGEDPLVALTAMAPWIRRAHLKDHQLVAGGSIVQGVALGDGRLPIDEITRRLAALGVDPICFESSWGYAAPVRTQPEAFTGTFAPTDATPIVAEELAPLEAMDLERQAFVDGARWLSELEQRLFNDLG